MTYNGSLPALIDPIPRIRILLTAPGAPDELVTVTPGTEPDNLSCTEATGTSANLPGSTFAAAPVKLDFLKFPYPVTITSSREPASGFITTFIPFFTGTTTVLSPTYCTLNWFLPSGTERWKLPSISETVPICVPTTSMDAPTTGSPFSEDTTVPEISDCANATPKHRNRPAKTIDNLLTISLIYKI